MNYLNILHKKPWTGSGLDPYSATGWIRIQKYTWIQDSR
jgi:hypothetical protein